MNKADADLRLSHWKAVISALWLIQAVNFIGYLLIIYLNGNFAGYSGLDDTADTPIVIAIFLAVPCLLICLTLVARPQLSRWPNVVLAAGFTLIKILATLEILLGVVSGADDAFPGGLFLNELWAIFAGALLVWFAWRIPNAGLGARRHG